MNDKTKGIVLLLAAAFGFSMMAAFIKLAGDVPTVQKAFFRNIVSVVVSFVMIVQYKESFFGRKENQKILLLRSVWGTLGALFFFYTIDHLILSDADMLNKLSPFLTILFAGYFLQEKIKSYQMISIMVAFAGALLIIKPSFSLETIPYLTGLLSAIFSASAYTSLRMIGNKEKFFTVVFYFSCFSTVVTAPFVILDYHQMSLLQLTDLILAGIFATIGQFGITLAYRFAPAREISIFFYSTVLYSMLFSIVLFRQTPDLFSISGYAVIIGTLIYVFMKNRSENEKQKRRLVDKRRTLKNRMPRLNKD